MMLSLPASPADFPAAFAAVTTLPNLIDQIIRLRFLMERASRLLRDNGGYWPVLTSGIGTHEFVKVEHSSRKALTLLDVVPPLNRKGLLLWMIEAQSHVELSLGIDSEVSPASFSARLGFLASIVLWLEVSDRSGEIPHLTHWKLTEIDGTTVEIPSDVRPDSDVQARAFVNGLAASAHDYAVECLGTEAAARRELERMEADSENARELEKQRREELRVFIQQKRQLKKHLGEDVLGAVTELIRGIRAARAFLMDERVYGGEEQEFLDAANRSATLCSIVSQELDRSMPALADGTPEQRLERMELWLNAVAHEMIRQTPKKLEFNETMDERSEEPDKVVVEADKRLAIYSFRIASDLVTIQFGAERGTTPRLRGHEHMFALLASPNASIAAMDLYSARRGSESKDGVKAPAVEPVVDAKTVASLKHAIETLPSQAAEARASGEIEKAEELDEQLLSATRYLSAVTHGGSAKVEEGVAGKARKAVANAIDDALDATEEKMPEFTCHMRDRIRKGGSLRYEQPEGIYWTVEVSDR